MTIPRRTFLIPSLLWLTRLAPQPLPDTHAGTGPWLGGRVADVDDLKRIVQSCGPPIMALNLAGYEIDSMAIAFAHDVDHHLMLDLDTMYFTVLDTDLFNAVGTIGSWPDHTDNGQAASAVIALQVAPRYRFRPSGPVNQVGSRLSMPMPLLTATPDSGADDGIHWPWSLHATFTDATAGWLVIGLFAPDPLVDLNSVALIPGINSALETMVPVLCEDLEQRIDQLWPPDDPMPARDGSRAYPPPTPGLLFLLDPAVWRFRLGEDLFKKQMQNIGWRIFESLAPVERDGPGADPRIDRRHFLEKEILGSNEALLLNMLRRPAASVPSEIYLNPTVHWYGESMQRKASEAVLNHLSEESALTHRRAHDGAEPDLEGLNNLNRLPYLGVLMVMHMFGVVDLLGAEDLLAPQAEWLEIDATGFYEQRSGDNLDDPQLVGNATQSDDTGIAADTLQINIAGHLMRGYWQVHGRNVVTLRTLYQHKIVAVLHDATTGIFRGARYEAGNANLVRFDNQGPQTIADEWGDPTPGVVWLTIEIGESGQLIWLEINEEIGGSRGETWTFLRLNGNAFVTDLRINRVHSSILDLYEQQQRWPLHSVEGEAVIDWLGSLKLDIEHFYSRTSPGARQDSGQATTVNSNFKAHAAPYFQGAHYASHQYRAVQHLMRVALRSQRWQPAGDVELSYWEGLLEIGGWNPDQTRDVQHFFELQLDLTPDWDWGQLPSHIYMYCWSLQPGREGFSGIGGGVPPKGPWGGMIAYERLQVTAYRFALPSWGAWEDLWTQDYDAALVAWEPGWGITGYMGFWASGVSIPVTYALGRESFDGVFTGSGANLAATLGWADLKAWMPRLPGLPCEPELDVQSRDGADVIGFESIVFVEAGDSLISLPGALPTFTAGFSQIRGGSIGATGSLKLGVAWQTGSPRFLQEVEALLTKESFEEHLTLPNATRFFETNVYELDDEMRDQLREFCVQHLHVLRQVDAVMEIVGHADSQGPESNNADLGRNRAIAFYQGVRDILGPHLFISEEQSFIGGRGEQEHQRALERQRVGGETLPEDPSLPDAQFRRVDVFLGGFHVVSIEPGGDQ